MTLSDYAGYRFPSEVIQRAVWMYLRFTLSYRDVEDLLAERGIEVSYETPISLVNSGDGVLQCPMQAPDPDGAVCRGRKNILPQLDQDVGQAALLAMSRDRGIAVVMDLERQVVADKDILALAQCFDQRDAQTEIVSMDDTHMPGPCLAGIVRCEGMDRDQVGGEV